MIVRPHRNAAPERVRSEVPPGRCLGGMGAGVPNLPAVPVARDGRDKGPLGRFGE
jgi:hypothetical protein